MAFLRRRANLTGRRLSLMIGELPSTISRLESGEIDLEPYKAKVAKAIGCKPEELFAPKLKVKSVPVTCYVKNKNYVTPMPKAQIKQVAVIDGLPKTTEVCIIKNPDLKYIHGRNELLYFDSVPTTKESVFLGRECIVKIDRKTRGDTLLAWVSRGTKKGTYMLHAHREPILEDVTIISAHIILASKKV